MVAGFDILQQVLKAASLANISSMNKLDFLALSLSLSPLLNLILTMSNHVADSTKENSCPIPKPVIDEDTCQPFEPSDPILLAPKKQFKFRSFLQSLGDSGKIAGAIPSTPHSSYLLPSPWTKRERVRSHYINSHVSLILKVAREYQISNCSGCKNPRSKDPECRESDGMHISHFFFF